MKFCFCLIPVSVFIDAYVTIFSYVLCVHSLITRLQLKKMSVMYESAHDSITFQLLEISSITTPNQKQFQIFTHSTFFKGFLGKISALHNDKKLIWKLRVNRSILVTGAGVNLYQIS